MLFNQLLEPIGYLANGQITISLLFSMPILAYFLVINYGSYKVYHAVAVFELYNSSISGNGLQHHSGPRGLITHNLSINFASYKA